MSLNNIQEEHSKHKQSPCNHTLCFLTCDVSDPLNIGSLFRIADALGVEKIFITGTSSTPPNTKIKKSSRSTEKYVAYEYSEDAISVANKLKNLGYKIISLEITTQSIALSDLKLHSKDKICLVLGAENEGVSEALLELSDATVHIPMHGVNSSMNVACACAIATYELSKMLAD